MTAAPNILFIMCDSLAPHFMGAYGDSAGATPNLDRLAAKAVVFENAYVSCPLCAPSRASIVTGRYASELRCFDNGSPFSSTWPTIGHALGAAGYETVIIGKMHFVGHDQHHGFDHRIALKTDYSKGYNPLLYKLAYDWTQASAGNPNSPEMMAESYIASLRWQDYRLHFERDEIIHEAALAYLARDKPAPFFACVSYHAPHNPFWIPKAERNRFRGKALALPVMPKNAQTVHGPMDVWLNDFHYLPQLQKPLMAKDNLRWLYETFYGMIFDLDRRVGELLEALGNKLQNTVVVFTSDHGDMMGERGMVQKRYFYEKSVRVPLLLSLPGRPGGVRHSHPVSLLDLFPTLAGLARAPLPDDLPGQSLLPSIMDGQEHENRTLYMEYHGEGVHAPCFMLRRGHYKYIYVHGFEERLYDLAADPSELENLARASHETVLELRQSLLERFEPEAIAKAALQSQRVRKFVYDCEVSKAKARSL